MYSDYSESYERSVGDKQIYDMNLLTRHFHALRVDCAVLQRAVERELRTGGLCKRYARTHHEAEKLIRIYSAQQQRNNVPSCKSDNRLRQYFVESRKKLKQDLHKDGYCERPDRQSRAGRGSLRVQRLIRTNVGKVFARKFTPVVRQPLVLKRPIEPTLSPTIFAISDLSLNDEENIQSDSTSIDEAVDSSDSIEDISCDLNRCKKQTQTVITDDSVVNEYNSNNMELIAKTAYAKPILETSENDSICSAPKLKLFKSKNNPGKSTSLASNIAKPTEQIPLTIKKRPYSDYYIHRRGKASTQLKKNWLPVCTVPHPFLFTERKTIRARYSEEFLHTMLAEKHSVEEADQQKFNQKFKANSVPSSTYKADDDIYYRMTRTTLLRRQKSAEIVACRQRLIATALASRCFRHTPVPASTFCSPATTGPAKVSRHERAVELLRSASEPRGMKEHSKQWTEKMRARHSIRCLGNADQRYFRRVQSAPDFRRIHQRMHEHISELAATKQSPTIVEPFRFSDSTPPHFCWNWTRQDALEMRRLRKQARYHPFNAAHSITSPYL